MRQQALIDELRSVPPSARGRAAIARPDDADRAAAAYRDDGRHGRPGRPLRRPGSKRDALRDWYTSSGKAILGAAGESPEMADKIAQGLAITSKATPVATNLSYAATAHNQAMLGGPIRAGRFPNQMGADIEGAYYAGEPLQGNKIEPFLGATAEEWNPNFAHTFVNDTHNMRASEFPGKAGGLYTIGSPIADQWKGTPTIGEHNFTRILYRGPFDGFREIEVATATTSRLTGRLSRHPAQRRVDRRNRHRQEPYRHSDRRQLRAQRRPRGFSPRSIWSTSSRPRRAPARPANSPTSSSASISSSLMSSAICPSRSAAGRCCST